MAALPARAGQPAPASRHRPWRNAQSYRVNGDAAPCQQLRVAPERSIEVAAEWRSRHAPVDGGSEMPARFSANATIVETWLDCANGRYGAIIERNTAS